MNPILPHPRKPLRSSFCLAFCAALLLGGCGLSNNSAKSPPAEPLRVQPVPVALENADFEKGARGWDFSEAGGTASVSEKSAFEGKCGLQLQCDNDTKGAAVSSVKMPADPGCTYELFWQARVRRGTGICVYLRFFDSGGKELSRELARVYTESGTKWAQYKIAAVPPAGAKKMDVYIRRPSDRSPTYTIDFDNFRLVSLVLPSSPPWPGTYKLRPDDKRRLTAADVIGPDGHVYPDFTFAGVQGGIPNPPVRVHLKDLGAQPGADISKLLEAAAGKVSAAGGGAVFIDKGDYYLDEPVFVFADNVTISGAGSGLTRLFFRYHIPLGKIRFFRLKPGQRIGPNDRIEFHANPKDLIALELQCGSNSLLRKIRKDHWGNTFSLNLIASEVIRQIGAGKHRFTAIAEYKNGARIMDSIELQIDESLNATEDRGNFLGAINFIGRGLSPNKVLLARDGKRGDSELMLAEKGACSAGDLITIVAPATERWKNLVGYTSLWHIQAQDIYRIVSVQGQKIRIDQPLRITFPVVDGSYVQKANLITNCGLQGVHLEQEVVPNQGPRGPFDPLTLWYPIEDLWTSGAIFYFAWNGWLKDVTIRNTGRNAAYFPMSKHIEVRDCLFDNSLFKGGGGTGYVGFDRSWDCLIDHIEVRGMRHAPNNQWNSSGNVVRNSRFLGSDGQWHAGFTVENLYEGNFIDSRGNGGSYGHGLFASGPSSGLHGPQGPRNVVYHNDIISSKSGIQMLGGNEAWLILHNRFIAETGCAVFAKEKSFDHVIENNIFVLKNCRAPAVQLGSDSTGVELRDNAFFGTKPPLAAFAGGRIKLAIDKGNSLEARIPMPPPSLPAPEVSSIFQWQKDNAEMIKKNRESYQ